MIVTKTGRKRDNTSREIELIGKVNELAKENSMQEDRIRALETQLDQYCEGCTWKK